MRNVYQMQGYADREDYLRDLADEYDVPFDIVLTLAEMLGPNEDFDGLVTAVEDVPFDCWDE